MANIEWVNVESLVKPEDVDAKMSPNGVYVRRFITPVEVEATETQEAYTKYTYTEAFMTQEEYSQYLLLQEISSQVLGEESTDAYLLYKQQLNTPVLYETNGHYYKPKWAADIYEAFVDRGEKFPELFPIRIWDATEEADNAVEMTLEELRALTVYLGGIQEEYFYAYKLSKNS